MPRQKKNWDKEWEIPEAEQGLTYDDGFLFSPDTDDPPPIKKLKRDLEREALTRLEEAARTEEDFREIVKKWNHLDENRERRERYHEVLRGNKTPPLEFNMIPDGFAFPASLNGVLARQNRKGDFLDTIHYCPYEVQELVADDYVYSALRNLPDDRKQLLFLRAVEYMSSVRIAQIRGQSDRNVRKIWATLKKKLRKSCANELSARKGRGQALTGAENAFLKEYMEKGA